MSDAERDELMATAARVGAYDRLTTRDDLFVAEAQIQAAGLPESVRRALRLLRRRDDPSCGLLVRGLPVDVGDAAASAAVLSVVVAPLGDQRGRCLAMAFGDSRADFSGFLCLRAGRDRAAEVRVATVDAIVPRLDPATVAQLRRSRYETAADPWILRSERLYWRRPVSVLGGGMERPLLRVHPARTRGLDRDARRALDVLREAIGQVTATVRLAEGDMAVVDDYRAVCEPVRCPDRQLLRTFVTRRTDDATVRVGDGPIVEADAGVSALTRSAPRPTSR